MRSYRLQNPYRVDFEAVVMHVSPDGLLLDDTRFVYETNEHSSDIGTVDGLRINRVKRRNSGVVVHCSSQLGSFDRLNEGQRVHAEVDWGQRYARMRLRSAQHLCSFALTDLYGVTRRRNRFVDGDASRADYFPTVAASMVDGDAVIDWVSRAIADDLTITTVAQGGDPDRLFWNADGVGAVACSALHPRSTLELAGVALKVEPITAGVRVSISLPPSKQNAIQEEETRQPYAGVGAQR